MKRNYRHTNTRTRIKIACTTQLLTNEKKFLILLDCLFLQSLQSIMAHFNVFLWHDISQRDWTQTKAGVHQITAMHLLRHGIRCQSRSIYLQRMVGTWDDQYKYRCNHQHDYFRILYGGLNTYGIFSLNYCSLLLARF